MKAKPTILTASACLLAAGGLWWWLVSRPPEPQPQHIAIEKHRQQARDDAESVAAEPPDQNRWLHPGVKTVIGQPDDGAGQLTFRERREAVKTLPHNLAAIDHHALLEFINGERPADCNPGSWHAMADAIINVLRRQEKPVAGFTQALVRLHYGSPDPVLKDYALQYLRCRYVDRDGFHQHETDPALCKLILETLLDAAAQAEQSYSGTALMGLDAIDSSSALKGEPTTRDQISAHLDDLNAVLIKAATDPQTDKHCRISALQVCALRGLAEILPAARVVATDPKADPNVRISAIAAIGQLGTLEEDATLLKQLKGSGHRLACAVGPALKKLASN